MTTLTVKLNVGRTLFETTRTTLQGSAFFRALFDNWTITEAPYFIDRSPILFEEVLRLLRDPNYNYPEQYTSELDFYQIEYDKIDNDEITLKDLIDIVLEIKTKVGLCYTQKCTSRRSGCSFLCSDCILTTS